MLAAVGAGLHLDVPAAARRLRGPRHAALQPNGERQAVYAEAYGRYRRLYAALRPLF
jgi:ribulose kinase